MADIADVATDIIEQDLGHTLANLPKFDTPSYYECQECGEEIPEQRRKHGGITRCIACQTNLEAKQKHLRG